MIKYSFYKVSTMFSHRKGTMERDFLPRAKTWKTVRRTRNQDAAHAHKRVTAPLRMNSGTFSRAFVFVYPHNLTFEKTLNAES